MKNTILPFLVCIFAVQISIAQWQADVRLTNNPAASYTKKNCIASSGSAVNTVWEEYRDGNAEIYYKRSTDGGAGWGTDTRLTNNTADSYDPSVTLSGSGVHVVWVDYRDANYEIYYKRSTDGGVNWSTDTRLTNNTANSSFPIVTLSGSVVHVVWYDNRDGSEQTYYKRSTDGGISWGADTRLSNGPAGSSNPSIIVSGTVVHLAWNDFRDGINPEIYYKRSSDEGLSWSTDLRLTNNTAYSDFPSITVSGTVVHVVWSDSRDGNYEIYYKRSTDAGLSWSADTRLTNNPADSKYISSAASGLVVHLVWEEYRDGNPEIYYKRSTDGGASWAADTRLTNNTAESHYPSLSVSGTAIHVVWADFRDGSDPEIYYKRDPTGNPVGIIHINSEIPDNFLLSQNYPNPFNPNTKINFSIPQKSNVTIKVYNTLGVEVNELVNETLEAGNYSADFDGSALASGVYFYRLNAESGGKSLNKTLKMLLVK